jgi:hypothetical protein
MDAATDKQKTLVRTLLAERAGNPVAAEVRETLNENLSNLTKTIISEAISTLLKLPKSVAPAPVADVKPGTYTLVRSDGTYRTLQFTTPKWADNKLTVAYLSGNDNECSYTGFAFVNTDANGKLHVQMWSRYKGNLELRSDLDEFLTLRSHDEAHKLFLDKAESYALESGSCMRCGRTLTVPASLHRGLGPECAKVENF